MLPEAAVLEDDIKQARWSDFPRMHATLPWGGAAGACAGSAITLARGELMLIRA